MIRPDEAERIDVKRVEEFATALDDALHDVATEATRRVVFVYDADVIVGTILGATAHVEVEAQMDVRHPRIAVRSLLGSGAFGPLRMLRPHLMEFDRVVRSLPRPPERLPRGYLASQRDRLVRMWGFDRLESWMREMRLRFESPTPEQDAASILADEFFRFLDSEGFRTFVLAELCLGGTWFNRLHTLVTTGVLTFGEVTSLDSFDLRGERVSEFLGALGKRRHQKSPATINNLVDAAALSVLASLNESGARLGLAYRFYTETEAVRDAVLQCGITAASGNLGQRSILRSPMYFLVRASFPSLHPSGSRAATIDFARETALAPSDLSALLTEIRKVLASLRPGEDIERALASYSILGTPLNRLLADFFRMNFVLTYVRSDRTSDASLRQLLPELQAALQNQAVVSQTSLTMNKAVLGLRADIDRELGALGQWKSVLDDIRKSVDRQRSYFGQAQEYRAESPLPTVDYDLGLIRWDLDSLATQKERLSGLMELLMSASEREETLMHCAEVASLFVQDELDEGDKEYLLLALWWLRDWQLLMQHWTARIPNASVIGREFRPLMLIARARLLFEEADSPRDVTTLVDGVRMLFADAEAYLRANTQPTRNGFRLMTVAHVGYWCWQVLKKVLDCRSTNAARESTFELTAEIQREIAFACFDAGKHAYRELPVGSPARLFAANHCAYVGTIARIEEDDTEAFMKALTKDTTNHRNFRIADTLAKPFSMHAEILIAKYGLEGVRRLPPIRKEVMENLQQARDFLHEGRPFFGDDEATKHLANVQRLINHVSDLH